VGGGVLKVKFPKKWCPLFGLLPKLEEPEIPQAATCRRIINEARQIWGLPAPIPLPLKKKARNRNWPQSSDFVDPQQVKLGVARKIWEKAEEIFLIEETSITQAEWKFYKDAPIPEKSLIQAHPKSLLHSVRMATNYLPEIKDLPTHKTLPILSIRKAWTALQALSTEDYLQNWTKITNQINEAQILLNHNAVSRKQSEISRNPRLDTFAKFLKKIPPRFFKKSILIFLKIKKSSRS
jgi:hypothetical protein